MGAIYLVRHGQAGAMALGAEYDRLSETGVAQARLAGLELGRRGIAPTRVAAGSMRRQQASAAVLVEAMGAAGEAAGAGLVQLDARLDEYDHRDVLLHGGVGPLAASAKLSWPPRIRVHEALERALDAWVGSPQPDRYRETFEQFAARAQAAVADLAADRSATTVAVTSAGVICAVVAGLWGLDAQGWLAAQRVMVNASITTLAVGKRGMSLIAFNDHAHLAAPMAGSRTVSESTRAQRISNWITYR